MTKREAHLEESIRFLLDLIIGEVRHSAILSKWDQYRGKDGITRDCPEPEEDTHVCFLNRIMDDTCSICGKGLTKDNSG